MSDAVRVVRAPSSITGVQVTRTPTATQVARSTPPPPAVQVARTGPPGQPGIQGPPGEVGPPGADSGAAAARFSGHGPPPAVIVGAEPLDLYLDIDTGDLYRLE